MVRDIVRSEISFKYEVDCTKLQTLATADTVGFGGCDRSSSINLGSLDWEVFLAEKSVKVQRTSWKIKNKKVISEWCIKLHQKHMEQKCKIWFDNKTLLWLNIFGITN